MLPYQQKTFIVVSMCDCRTNRRETYNKHSELNNLYYTPVFSAKAQKKVCLRFDLDIYVLKNLMYMSYVYDIVHCIGSN